MKKNILIKSILLLAGLLVSGTVQAQITLTFTENGGTSATGGTDPYTSLGVQSDNKTQGTVDGYQLPGNSSASPAGYYINGSTLDFGTVLGTSQGDFDTGGYPQFGWIAIYAPGGVYGTTQGLLDLIHFDNSGDYTYNPTTGGYTYTQGSGTQYQQMFWYSLEGSGNLADNWLPANIVSQVLGYHFTTDITENANGLATYTPGSQYKAGYTYNSSSGSPIQYTYDFQSSVAPIPEPSTVFAGALLLLPMGISLMRFLSRKRATERQS